MRKRSFNLFLIISLLAILVRIKLPNRSEHRKIVRTKKDNFTLLGDNYTIDWNCAYWTKIHAGWTKIQCLDYEKGQEFPIKYFAGGVEEPKTKHKAHHIATVIDLLINQIPHFQLIVIIMLCICIAAAGIGAYLAYDAGSKAGAAVDLMRYYFNQSGLPPIP